MTDAPYPISRWAIMSLAGFTLGGSYFFIQGLEFSKHWWLLGLLLIFVCITALVAFRTIKQSQHIALGILLFLCIAMMLVSPKHIAMLYVVICLLAIETQKKRTAIYWVSTCVVAVMASELLQTMTLTNLQDAIVNGLLTVFLSGFAFLRIEAETGRRHTRQLLLELEKKNSQLANFAAEREQQSRIEERQNLSRELHDTLGHKLTTSIVQLEAAQKFLEKDPSRVQTVLTTTRNLLKEGLDETRDIVRILDQHETQEKSLKQVITDLVDNFRSLSDIKIHASIDCNDLPINTNIKQHVYRITQEALTNISRHANASEVSITLDSNDLITLCVEDNGERLAKEVEILPPVKSIESRVAELQGKISFERSKGLTRLLVEIPIDLNGEKLER